MIICQRMVFRSLITHKLTFLLGCSLVSCACLLHRTWDYFPDESAIDLTPTFTFPSPEARVKYYMGDWFGHSLTPENIQCDEIVAVDEIRSDQPVLWRASKMKYEIKTNEKKDWLIGSYLVDSFDVIKRTAIGHEKDVSWLFLYIGDSHSKSTKLPVVAKTRFSRFATEKNTGKHFFDQIIFPLEMRRHFDPVNEYIKLHKGGRVCKWKDKKSTLIWRGAMTGVESSSVKNMLTTHVDGGPRVQVVKKYFNAKISDVDVAFQEDSPTVSWLSYELENEARLVRGSDTSMADQLKYKYILMLEGNDVATGLKWQLASNSVVFMAKPTTVSFLMEDLLVPFVHYVPLKDDYSNLIEMVHWARRNDKKCKWISEQATSYMQRLWMSKRAKEENAAIKRNLGEIYQRQFGKAAKSCAKKFLSSVDEFGNRMVQFH
ncbi:hypothetical protein ACHAXR_008015 [Thalassiosira sp. AJA248-18]